MEHIMIEDDIFGQLVFCENPSTLAFGGGSPLGWQVVIPRWGNRSKWLHTLEEILHQLGWLKHVETL